MRLMLFYISIFIFSSYSIDAHVKIITDSNWENFMKDEWMILLYAPWCPACQNVKPTWEYFAIEIRQHSSINVAIIDITKNHVVSGSFSISRLPTIFHIKDGVFRQYTGNRQLADFVKFVTDQEYNAITPLQWYYNPSSIHMRAVGHLFHLSQIILNIQQNLATKYGLPIWMSYVIIGCVIVVAGISLSLLFLCLMLIISRLRFRKVSARNPEKFAKHSAAMEWDSEILPEPKDVLHVEAKVGQISLDGDNQSENESAAEEKKTK